MHALGISIHFDVATVLFGKFDFAFDRTRFFPNLKDWKNFLNEKEY